jgi:hypothetical protein
MSTVPAEGQRRQHLDALRALITAHPLLAEYPPLLAVLGGCSSDDEFDDVLFTVKYFTRLRAESRGSLTLARQAEALGMGFQLTLLADPAARSIGERSNVQMAPRYARQKS